MEKYVVDLWKNYNMAKTLILDAMGGISNIEGEFAEQLVASYYNGRQLTASSKSADIVLDNGTTIQVKARVPRQTMTTSLGIIRSWDFDFLVAVLFSTDGAVIKAVEMDAETAKSLAVPNKLQNGWVITTTSEFLNHNSARDISENLNAILAGSTALFPSPHQLSQQGGKSTTEAKKGQKTPPFINATLSSSPYREKSASWNGITMEVCKRENESFQNFVKRTLRFMFANKMIPIEEISLLQTKAYSKRTLGLEMPLIETDTNKLRDGGCTSRYWVKEIFDNRYYICSQWWKQNLVIYEPKFADWIKHIIALNESKNLLRGLALQKFCESKI